jgi:hypothetical protein
MSDDSCIYGCEIWGTLTNAILQKTTDIYDLFKEWEFEKLNTKFCKYILGVNRRSTNIAILSELGKYPLHISLLVNLIFLLIYSCLYEYQVSGLEKL